MGVDEEYTVHGKGNEEYWGFTMATHNGCYGRVYCTFYFK
jgi:hypothetical protein